MPAKPCGARWVNRAGSMRLVEVEGVELEGRDTALSSTRDLRPERHASNSAEFMELDKEEYPMITCLSSG